MTVISLVQPNFAMSLTKDRFFLPYSAATIWAYIASFNDTSIDEITSLSQFNIEKINITIWYYFVIKSSTVPILYSHSLLKKLLKSYLKFSSQKTFN